MVKRQQRSTSYRRVARKTAKGTNLVKVKREDKHKASCAVCGKEYIKKKAKVKSSRRPQRMYGGQLCSNCLADVLKYRARLNESKIKQEEVPLIYLKYVVG
ncbi:MAG: 50S ribosomal protein L34e [Methanobacteriota archaeon]|nr:MAG: 50S ribosomal protein L34e [Euryarchaeota archaeon]